jgi:hypothetical protein
MLHITIKMTCTCERRFKLWKQICLVSSNDFSIQFKSKLMTVYHKLADSN